MPWLWLVEFFGRIALKYGLVFLERKYPGVKPILDKVIKWIEGQAATGNQDAIDMMAKHVDTLCDSSVIGCGPQLKN